MAEQGSRCRCLGWFWPPSLTNVRTKRPRPRFACVFYSITVAHLVVEKLSWWHSHSALGCSLYLSALHTYKRPSLFSKRLTFLPSTIYHPLSASQLPSATQTKHQTKAKTEQQHNHIQSTTLRYTQSCHTILRPPSHWARIPQHPTRLAERHLAPALDPL